MISKKILTSLTVGSLALTGAGFATSTLLAASAQAATSSIHEATDTEALDAYTTVKGHDTVKGTNITGKSACPTIEFSKADVENVLTALNAIRGLAGSPQVTSLPETSEAWHESNLGTVSMTEQAEIEHGLKTENDQEFACYTEGGAKATKNSVLSAVWGSAEQPTTHIRNLITDLGVPSLGHRLQMLNPALNQAALSASYRTDSTMKPDYPYVSTFTMTTLGYDGVLKNAPENTAFAWPSAGYFPAQLLPAAQYRMTPVWSFTLSGVNSLEGAQVSYSTDGTTFMPAANVNYTEPQALPGPSGTHYADSISFTPPVLPDAALQKITGNNGVLTYTVRVTTVSKGTYEYPVKIFNGETYTPAAEPAQPEETAPAAPAADSEALAEVLEQNAAKKDVVTVTQDGNTATLTVSGASESASYYVYAYSNPVSLGKVTTNASGSFTVDLSSLPDGQHTLTVQEQDGTLVGWVSATVSSSSTPGDDDEGTPEEPDVPAEEVPAAPASTSEELEQFLAKPENAAKETSVTIAQEEGKENTPILTIAGASENEKYYVYAYSTPTALGAFTTDNTGSFTVDISNLPAGEHTLTVQEMNGTFVGWARAVVNANTPDAPDTPDTSDTPTPDTPTPSEGGGDSGVAPAAGDVAAGSDSEQSAATQDAAQGAHKVPAGAEGESLASTGGELGGLVLGALALMTVGGAAAVAAARRRSVR